MGRHVIAAPRAGLDRGRARVTAPDRRPVLEVTTSRTGGSVRLRPVGELDIATAGRLVDALSAVSLGDPPDAVRLDLGQVTFLDAAGLGALVRVRALLAERAATLVLTDVPPRIRVLLELTGLADAFVLE